MIFDIDDNNWKSQYANKNNKIIKFSTREKCNFHVFIIFLLLYYNFVIIMVTIDVENRLL